MTKKKSSGGSAASVRKELQRVDRDLVKLLGDRARAAQKLAKLRQDDGAALYDLTEEQQEVAELVTQNKSHPTKTNQQVRRRYIHGRRRKNHWH